MQAATDLSHTISRIFATYPLPARNWGWFVHDGEIVWATPSGYGTQMSCTGRLIQLPAGRFVMGRKGDGRRLLEFARGHAQQMSADLDEHVATSRDRVIGRKRVIETVRVTRNQCRISVEWDGPVDNGSVRFVLPPPFVTYRGKSGFIYRKLVQE